RGYRRDRVWDARRCPGACSPCCGDGIEARLVEGGGVGYPLDGRHDTTMLPGRWLNLVPTPFRSRDAGIQRRRSKGNSSTAERLHRGMSGSSLVIFNLFALEGYHVSEALFISSAVCHPYLMTVSPTPSSFPNMLRRTYPRLYRRLTRVLNKPRRGRLENTWDHVEHWMWPLFTNRWGTFWERVGLDPCPLQDDLVAKPSEPRGEGLTLADNGCLMDASPYWPECGRVCGCLFPSPASSTHPKGGRAGENSSATLEERLGIPPSVEGFLSVREGRPIYVGFGSMWGMCMPWYRLAFALRVLLLGARQAGARFLLESATDWLGEFAASAGRGNLSVSTRDLRLRSCGERWINELAAPSLRVAGSLSSLETMSPSCCEDFDHGCFLSRCSAAIHHGGSGTTAAVLRAGIPHVVCPQQLDQFFWAERVRYLAVGSVLERSLFVGRVPAPTAPLAPLVGKESAAISSPQVKLRAACLGVKVRAESGLEKALDSLSLFMRNRLPRSAVLPREAINATASTQLHMATLPPTLDHDSAGKGRAVEEDLEGAQGEILAAGESGLSVVDKVDESLLSGGGRVGIDKDAGEVKLVLREMPNGLTVWWGSRAEEEAFFIDGKVFEDGTYARMDIRVQDGDTVWDVG
ncbi:unnamed protein product, partial [Ectocarpus fasciculatus]